METRRIYEFGPSRQLAIVFGDIATSSAEVLVSSDDYYLSMGGGVSATILRLGGEAIARDAAKRVPLRVGDVVVTTAGNLPAKYVFHAVTTSPPGVMRSEERLDNVVEQLTRRCMELLVSL